MITSIDHINNQIKAIGRRYNFVLDSYDLENICQEVLVILGKFDFRNYNDFKGYINSRAEYPFFAFLKKRCKNRKAYTTYRNLLKQLKKSGPTQKLLNDIEYWKEEAFSSELSLSSTSDEFESDNETLDPSDHQAYIEYQNRQNEYSPDPKKLLDFLKNNVKTNKPWNTEFYDLLNLRFFKDYTYKQISEEHYKAAITENNVNKKILKCIKNLKELILGDREIMDKLEIEEYIIEKISGTLTEANINAAYEKDIESGKYDSLIQEYTTFINLVRTYGIGEKPARLYSLVKSMVRESSEISSRSESAFGTIKETRRHIFNIAAVADAMDAFAPATSTLAAATKTLNLFPEETLLLNEYIVEIETGKGKLTLRIEKNDEPYTGEFGFILKLGDNEIKIPLSITDGFIEMPLLPDNQVTKNDDVQIKFYIP